MPFSARSDSTPCRFLHAGRLHLVVGLLTLATSLAHGNGDSFRVLLAPVGEAHWDQFGRCVSGAGDVNGDGYADLIVGAPNNDAGGFPADNVGRAYVYYGGPEGDDNADLVMTGTQRSGSLGNSVADAGDFNADGFSDLIAGAFLVDVGGFDDVGEAYLYFGGRGADETVDLTMTGEAWRDEFGRSVGRAGDVNGDGYADVIVGAWANDDQSNRGRAYVYYGGPNADSTADLAFTGQLPDELGWSVASAGDVNGDGYDDVIVGARMNSGGGGHYAGRAYVYFGGPDVNEVEDVSLGGEARGDNFGQSVAGAGDVNGDGYADVIVGAWLNDAGGADAGRAYVFFGGPSMDAIADLTLTGEEAEDNFGCSVAGAGDVNGDGHSDMIVGAPMNDAGGVNTGRAYVYYGGPDLDSIADVTLTGENVGDQFGCSVAGAGDVDGNGTAEVIVGAKYYDAGPIVDAGRAYVVTIVPANQDPECRGAMPSVCELWPPDHGLVPVEIIGVTDPDDDPVTVTVRGVTQDEPLLGLGDDHTCPDALIENGVARLRAERSGNGNGRVYVISFRADDGRGGACNGSVSVCVPHDRRSARQRGRDPGVPPQFLSECIDDGRAVNSLGPCTDRGELSLETERVDRAELRTLGARRTEVVLEFSLPEDADVLVTVHDIAGRRIATLADSHRSAGLHRVRWITDHLPPGVYWCRLRAGVVSVSEPLVILH